MRRAAIDDQNRRMVERQRRFRVAADVVTEAWVQFPEVAAVAVIGSVAKPLLKEIPRFLEFRRAGIEVWHECGDLDLALWLHSQERLGDLRRVAVQALRRIDDNGNGVASHEVDVFLVDPATDRYLGRLCKFNQCPKGKKDCLVPGCGTIRFNKRVPGFVQADDLLAGVQDSMLSRRGIGRTRSALDLPAPEY
jgi:predicted metalloprotease